MTVAQEKDVWSILRKGFCLFQSTYILCIHLSDPLILLIWLLDELEQFNFLIEMVDADE